MTASRTYLIHYGEIGLKGRNRARFEERLCANLRYAARGLGVTSVRRLFGRIRLDQGADRDDRELERRLARVYGVSHFDPVRVYGWELDRLRHDLVASARQGGFSTFAIRARRIARDFPVRSMQLNRELGDLVREASGARVNLDSPERTYRVLALNRELFLYHRRVPGPGGLPVGAAGPVGVLLSGGIDSPVAGERLMRRGCVPVFVHFHSAPFTDRTSQEKAFELARMLVEHRVQTKLYLVPLGELQQKIVAHGDPGYRVILYRRYMLRLAARLARESGCRALATGESLGQVASQTLENIALLDRTVELPILRPLIGFDKQEIVDTARAIGTFDLSTEPHADCCSFLMPRNPITRGRLEDVERIEETLDVEDSMEEALAKSEAIDIG